VGNSPQGRNAAERNEMLVLVLRLRQGLSGHVVVVLE
jgi:hypothetical protein